MAAHDREPRRNPAFHPHAGMLAPRRRQIAHVGEQAVHADGLAGGLGGPAEAIRGSLGEPFTTSKPEGIGLGLTVARAVAEEHGGTLVWSRPHDHTRFAMTLPAQRLEGSATGVVEPGAS